MKRSCPILLLLLGVALSLPAAARSPLDDARRLLAQEDLDEALPLLEQAYATHPDPQVLRLLALTEYRLGRLKAAQARLTAALEAFPDDPELHAAQARILLRLGKPSEARSHVRFLRERAPGPGTDRLAGDLHAALGETPEAISAYRSAWQTTEDPRTRQDIALHLAPLLDPATAHPLLETAIAADPQGFDVPGLRRLLRGPVLPPYDFNAHLHYRFESDDNVRLQPDRPDFTTPGPKADNRHVLMADLLGRYGLGVATDLFAEAHLYRSFYQDLTEFDRFEQNYLLGLGWSDKKRGLRLPLEYNHSDVDGNLLSERWTLSPGGWLDLGKRGRLHGFVHLHREDFAAPGVTPADDQDNDSAGLGLLWTDTLASGKGSFRALLQWRRDDAEGDNWDRDLASLFLRADYRPLPRLTLGLGYQYDDYRYAHPHDFFLATRRDRIHSGSAWILWEFSPHWQAQLQGSLVNWDSNLEAFAYDRRAVSAGITWSY